MAFDEHDGDEHRDGPQDDVGAPEGPEGVSRRRLQRLPVSNLLVAIDAPEISAQPWVADAFDINSLGLGLVLPPDIPEGTQVLLSFKLSEDIEFSRVPATVLHQLGASGGVRFEAWIESDRLRLLEFLVAYYERV